MKNFNKTVIAPLITVVALGIGMIYGLNEAQIEQLEQTLLQGATAIATLISIYGVIKNHKKEESKK